MAGAVQDVGIPGRPGPSVQELLNRETRLVAPALRQEFNDSFLSTWILYLYNENGWR